MTTSEWVILVVGGLIAFDRILALIRGGAGDMKLMASRTKDLHDWHNVRDEDGVPVWYIRSSFAEAITVISKQAEIQTHILKEQGKILEKMADVLDRIERMSETRSPS